MADDNKMTYFLAGLGVGAVIGLLFAPKAGVETREFLSTKANEGRDYVSKKSREVADQAGEYYTRGRDVAGEYVSKGKETLARQKENIRSAVEVGKQAYRDVAGRSEMSGSEG